MYCGKCKRVTWPKVPKPFLTNLGTPKIEKAKRVVGVTLHGLSMRKSPK